MTLPPPPPPPIVYNSRLSPFCSAIVSTLPLFTVASYYTFRELYWFFTITYSHQSSSSPPPPPWIDNQISDNDSDSQFNLHSIDESQQLQRPVIPSPPPSWLTRLAFGLISLLIIAHAVLLFKLVYDHILSITSPLLDQFPWLLVQQCLLLLSWCQIMFLFKVRQFRWHYTWIVALLWALALCSSLVALYTHALVWTNPIPMYDKMYSQLTWSCLFVIPVILEFQVSAILSVMSALQFYRVSKLTRYADSEYSIIPNELPTATDQHTHSTLDPTTKFKPPKSVADYTHKFKKLAPFVYPKGDRYLQYLISVCLLLLIVGRIVNVLLPLQAKILVDRLTTAGSIQQPGHGILPWEAIAMYVVLRFLQGGVGLITTTQDLLWLPVERKTGEILRVQDRGVSSIVSLLSTVMFNIVPTLIDIIIAVGFFSYQFDLWFGFIVFVTMTLYIFATIMITEIRTKHRRRSNALENVMEAKAVDSLLNFETVKLYNNEQFESAEYAKALADYQDASWISSLTTSWLSMTQNLIIQAGLLAGALLCAHRVSISKSMSVGDFVLYLSYITQLYGPLNQFGSYYRQLQKNFVDMEKMLDLLAQVPEVQDPPLAVSVSPCVMRGQIQFENVTFAYDSRVPTLQNVSFAIKAGQTVALVGSSGSGKSTILRLLFRFYDVISGRILIDGIDIRTMSQHDLRNLIGVVPQDTVLFNDSIKYNIRYGRVTASDHEVELAAQAAQIHDRIIAFPDQYETRVGERGMRLSGGERQRTSIARAILKNPVITFLDEATSALDTTTERMLQNQLMQLTTDRTTLIIAHRLSTIIHADMILVVHQGEILERGSHHELMQNTQGMYHDMWMKQLRDNQDLLLATLGSEGGMGLNEPIIPKSPISVTSPTSPLWIFDSNSQPPLPTDTAGLQPKKLRLGASKMDIPKSPKTSPVGSKSTDGMNLLDSDDDQDSHDDYDQSMDYSEDIVGEVADSRQAHFLV